MIPISKNAVPDAEAVVVDILAHKPRVAMKELSDYFQKKYKPGMTLQGLYKVVKHLTDQRVIVKEGNLVSLDAAWINNLMSFTEVLKRVYLQSDATFANIILEEGESRSFQFETPVSMDNFWTHVLVAETHYYAEQKHPDKNVYNYNHHSWFQLMPTHNEQTLVETYHQMNMVWYQVIGSKLFLDTLATQFIENDDFHFMQIDRGSLVKPNYYVVVLGDFITETSLPNYIFEQLEKLYQTVKSISEFNAQDILTLMKQPGRTTLTISRNKKRAMRLREEIRGVFRRTGSELCQS